MIDKTKNALSAFDEKATAYLNIGLWLKRASKLIADENEDDAQETIDQILHHLPIIKPEPQKPAPNTLDPDMPADQLRLHMGELSPAAVLIARAAIRWANSRAESSTQDWERLVLQLETDLLAEQKKVLEFEKRMRHTLDPEACPLGEDCDMTLAYMTGLSKGREESAGHGVDAAAPVTQEEAREAPYSMTVTPGVYPVGMCAPLKLEDGNHPLPLEPTWPMLRAMSEAIDRGEPAAHVYKAAVFAHFKGEP